MTTDPTLRSVLDAHEFDYGGVSAFCSCGWDKIVGLIENDDITPMETAWADHREQAVQTFLDAARDRRIAALKAVSRDLYSTTVAEHGHDEKHSADWPSCLPVHIALNRYKDALAATPSTEEAGS